MAAGPYTEDTLVQQTTADYLRDELGWESVYAYNQETFGPGWHPWARPPTRRSCSPAILRGKLEEFNPGLPGEAYRDATRQIVEYSHRPNHPRHQPRQVRASSRMASG